MDSRKLSHTVWECKYRIVWIPKRRRKVSYGKLRKEIGQIIRKLCEYKGIGIVEGNAVIDHIHLCIAIPHKTPYGRIIKLSALPVVMTFKKRQRISFPAFFCTSRNVVICSGYLPGICIRWCNRCNSSSC